MPMVPLPEDKAARIYQKMQLQAGEKELYYFSSVVVAEGKVNFSKSNRICAPLFMHPAEVVQQDEFYYLQIDFERRVWNFPLLKWLQSQGWMQEGSELKLVEALPEVVDFHDISNLIRAIEKYAPGLNAENLRNYPALSSEKKLKRDLNSANIHKHYQKVLPVGGVGIIKRPAGSLGVLNELESLANADSFSKPLRVLFEEATSKSRDAKPGIVPVNLSDPQQAILDAARNWPVSVAIGPPGTGKSFTIAAVATEHLLRGERVLICAKKDPAVDVVARKIEQNLGLEGVAIVSGKGRRMVPFRRMVKKHLNWNHNYSESRADLQLSRVKVLLDNLRDDWAEVEKQFDLKAQHEMSWGNSWVDLEGKNGLFSRFKRWRLKNDQPQVLAHWELVSKANKLLSLIRTAELKYLKAWCTWKRKAAFFKYSPVFRHFYNGLLTTNLVEKEKWFENVDWSVVTQAFPIWVMNHTELNEQLPLEKELFDLLIIDEATQCDIAAVLPAIQRAKRVLVVGDPNQLRHLSFLSRERQRHLQQRFGLKSLNRNAFDYRQKSILDVCLDGLIHGDQVNALDEHFRSRPEIIRFSNEKFYDGSIRIMTHNPGETRPLGLRFHKVEGQREADGHHPAEAEALVQHIERIILQHEEYSEQVKPSIGVISPFRDQINFLEKLISERISGQDMSRFRLFLGTPYTFQGEERDIVLLSLALDDHAHPSAWRHLNKEDVLNVAITRARNFQHVYHSFDSRKLPADSLIRKYVEQTPAVPDGPGFAQNLPLRDTFLEEVTEFLTQKSGKVVPRYRISGAEVDLIVSYRGYTKGIDLVGFPGDLADAIPLARYQLFQRAGLSIFPLSYASWLFEREECEKVLLKWLKKDPIG